MLVFSSEEIKDLTNADFFFTVFDMVGNIFLDLDLMCVARLEFCVQAECKKVSNIIDHYFLLYSTYRLLAQRHRNVTLNQSRMER